MNQKPSQLIIAVATMTNRMAGKREQNFSHSIICAHLAWGICPRAIILPFQLKRNVKNHRWVVYHPAFSLTPWTAPKETRGFLCYYLGEAWDSWDSANVFCYVSPLVFSFVQSSSHQTSYHKPTPTINTVSVGLTFRYCWQVGRIWQFTGESIFIFHLRKLSTTNRIHKPVHHPPLWSWHR